MAVRAETGMSASFGREQRIGRKAVAILVLFMCAIPALVTAALVWFSVGRPLLFRQLRGGLHGRSFTIVKFRTMHDWRDVDGKLLPDADRSTTSTRFLRATRLDEIPQLLAIAAGEMNFVGPRPLPPLTLNAFGAFGLARCEVRPGLTGWAQVNGNTRLSDHEKLALDIWYIDHRSAMLDARIIILTALTLLRGERVSEEHLATALSYLCTLQQSKKFPEQQYREGAQ